MNDLHTTMVFFLFHEKISKIRAMRSKRERERECEESMNEIFGFFFNRMEVMKLGLESGTRVLN
jgi:hypothetical protein